uniref:Putative tail protein n=1 Tax=viral metagenome TaxID=1070528 RepID=A0A6M3J0Y6_9ZZZZ
MDLLAKQLLKGVEGAASSVDGQIVVADGTTGKKIAFTNKQTLSATSPITLSNTPAVIASAAPVIAIPAATNAIPGHATAAQITKLDGIEAGAAALATVKADADVADAISKKHTQGTDQGLDTGGANAVVVADIKDAVTKKHTQNTDTDLDPTFEATFEKVANKDTTGGYAGLTLFKINFRNALNTITSFFTNAATVARTYTFPDKDITVAGTGDIDTHAGLTTGIHGVGAGTVAKVGDIAVDVNLSAAAQDAISKRHTQGTDVALGAVGTKNPPIDADKAIYRDSTASDALVTSTWTQIKAFLKTYFDTLYNLYVHPNHSGDVTSVADGAQTIANSAVTLAKMANMATASLIYRKTADAGAPEVNSLATLKTDLDLTGTNSGDNPGVTAVTGTSPVASSGGTTPAISIPAATNVAAGHATAAHITAIEANTAKVTNATHTGEVTGSGALTIVNDAVTYAKMQNVSATDKVLGRATAGAGDVEEIACTAAGRALIDDANAAAQIVTLGVLSIADAKNFALCVGTQ